MQHANRALTPPSMVATRMRSPTDAAERRPRVQVSGRELLTRMRLVTEKLGLPDAVDSTCWKPHRRLDNGFAMFTSNINTAAESEPAELQHWVLTTGYVRASLEEMNRVLATTTDSDFNAVMHAFYPKDFIHGNVVRVSSRGSTNTEQLAVKTSTFVRSNMWSDNEQWCFAEFASLRATRNSPNDATGDRRRLSITLASMAPEEVTVGKTPPHRRVYDHQGLQAGFIVEPSSTTGHVQIKFVGCVGGSREHNNRHDEVASQRNADKIAWVEHERLLRLAEGISHLPQLILRRRLGVQALTDQQSVQASNSRCICCTRQLLPSLTQRSVTKLMTTALQRLERRDRGSSESKRGILWLGAKACNLCGHSVCDACWSIKSVETNVGSVTTLRICTRCLEFVEGGDYSRVTEHSLGTSRVERDVPADSTNPPEEPTVRASQKLALLLLDRLRDAVNDQDRRRAVLIVIRQLVNDALTRRRKRLEDVHILKPESSESEHIAALRKCSTRLLPSVPLHECKLAEGPSGRQYQICVPEVSAATPPGVFPPPEVEQRRLEVIEKHRLDVNANLNRSHDLDCENEGELDVLCALAAREMQCDMGMITVVAKNHVTILGSNRAELRRRKMPRNQSFCQHAIMSDQPLLVKHPEADVRFQNIAARTKGDVRFYCGFPLRVALRSSMDKDSDEGGYKRTTIGVFCCADNQSHEMTQTHYATMAKLAETAARVLENKSREARWIERRRRQTARGTP